MMLTTATPPSLDIPAQDAAELLVIARIDDAPQGQLLSAPGGALELSDARRGDVAIIGTGGPYAVGLFSEETYGSATMFDIIERGRATSIVVRPQRAKRDVIRLVYERLGTADVELAADSTDIEILISNLIEDAIRRGASDIHIETRDNRADVFFRVNGEREFISNLAYDTAKGLGQVLYGVHADTGSKDIGWSIHELSESSIDHHTSRGERLQLRFSSSPIFPGDNVHIVIRLMSTRAQPRALASLGYHASHLSAIDSLTTGSGGMVLMCGPVNSGKSTSLQSLISRVYEVRGARIKVITVEDPVELVISGACQISVASRKAQRDGETSRFAAAMRGVLRQDPDVVMLGEIRDAESAHLATELAIAGRKVFVTLHTNSALWAFSRLRELGVRPSLLTMPGFIAGICYQKLIPVLCPHCSVADDAIAGESALHAAVRAAGTRSNVRRRGNGCSHCNGTGIIGRTLASEIVMPDRKLLALLAADQMVEAEAHWLAGHGNPAAAAGLVTAHDHALLKVLRGQVSLKDAMACMGVADQYTARGAAF